MQDLYPLQKENKKAKKGSGDRLRHDLSTVELDIKSRVIHLFSSPGRSPGRAIVLALASVLAFASALASASALAKC